MSDNAHEERCEGGESAVANSSGDDPIKHERMAIDVPIDNPEDVYISMRRIQSIEGLEKNKCKTLVINACLLTSMAGVDGATLLESLELSENKLQVIEGLSGMSHLKHLDLSFNDLATADGLESIVSTAEVLRLQNNRISKIPSTIAQMNRLRELELGSNKITKIENIPTKSLEQLWLGRNRITDDAILTAFDNYDDTNPTPALRKLTILSLQNNALKKFPSKLIEQTPNLRELYLSENYITTPPDDSLLALSKLTHLDLSYNKVGSLGVIPQMVGLKELWLNNNNISDLEEVKKLKSLINLETLYLDVNPFKDNLGPGYRAFISDLLPNLQQVDAVYLGKVVIKKAG